MNKNIISSQSMRGSELFISLLGGTLVKEWKKIGISLTNLLCPISFFPLIK
jgi:hypothetical protein